MSADLPPEAYTREVLQKAFDWLQNQPEPVRATIHTPENLVSLYRKSQRIQSDNPVSSKQFVSDLKSLATQFNQFDGGTQASPTPVFDFSQPSPEPKPAPPKQKVVSDDHTITETKKASFEVTTKTEKSAPAGLHLDPLTQEKVEKVKNRFNLSSDAEALRLIVSLGFEKFSEFQ